MSKTTPTKKKEISRAWHLIDAKGEILGRLATRVAQLLMGKRKPYFVRYLDCGDYVVVVNARQIATTGRKDDQKLYSWYSGFPGGLKRRTLAQLKASKPEEVIRHAVSGMLPKNKLRKRMLARLYVFAGEEHPYKNKLKIKNAK